MQQKTLQELSGMSDFNANLFAFAVEAVKIAPLIKSSSLHSEIILKKTLNVFAAAVGVEKPTNIGFMTHALNIFESLTDLIELTVKKNAELKLNKKTIPVCNNIFLFKKNIHRPTEFNQHSHKNTSCRYIFDLDKTEPEPLTKECIYVANGEMFDDMLRFLEKEHEIAVDVEHSNKSYEGLTCLIQISTRYQDYILDVLELWDRVGELKSVFGNGDVIKVMHGAEMDVKWLQRDFNLHIVNLFDTHRAARALGMQKLSYAFLLNHYCGVETDKQYQLADWRIRPLSPQMLHYARLDTHYLLYIFDLMRNDIAVKAQAFNIEVENALRDVFKASHEVTLIETVLFDFTQKELYMSLKREMSQNSFIVIHGLFETIDKVAHKENICFDELVPRKVLIELISRTKELLLDKSGANFQVKVEKMIIILQTKHVTSQLLLIELKQFLISAIATHRQSIQKESISIGANEKNENEFFKVDNKQKKIQTIETIIEEKSSRIKNNLIFYEYEIKRFEQPESKPFCPLEFEQINTFLTKKYSLQILTEAATENENELELIDEEHKAIPNEIEEENKEIISFGKVNPNVRYTVEPVEINVPKPKKKKKEAEYEKRLRNKSGNIYELLEE